MTPSTLGLRARTLLAAAVVLPLAVAAAALAISARMTADFATMREAHELEAAHGLRLQLERLLRYGLALEDIAGFEAQCREIAAARAAGSRATVATPQGRVLFDSDPAHMGRALPAGPLAALVASGRPGVATYLNDAHPHAAAVVPVTDRAGRHVASVGILMPQAAAEAALRASRRWSLAAGLGAGLAGAALLAAALAIFVTRPLGRLARAARAIAGGGAPPARAAREAGEIGTIRDALEQLYARAITAEAALQRARRAAGTAQAAHAHVATVLRERLRAPLQGILGMVGLLERSPLDAAQSRQVTVARHAGAHLARLVDALLVDPASAAGAPGAVPAAGAPRALTGTTGAHPALRATAATAATAATSVTAATSATAATAATVAAAATTATAAAAAAVALPAAPATPADPPATQPLHHGARILVAEAEPLEREILGVALGTRGYRVSFARGHHEAIEALATQPFDVALVDCRSAKLDGLEAVRAWRRREPHGRRLPIVALVHEARDTERAQCLAAGIDDCLPLAVAHEHLVDTLEHWLDARPAQAAALIEPAALEALRAAPPPGRPDPVRAALQVFWHDAPKLTTEMGEAAAAGDAERLRRGAARLKSEARAVGGGRLAQACHEVEADARAGDLARAALRLRELRSTLDETRAALPPGESPAG